MSPRAKGFTWVSIAYAVAIAIGWGVAHATRDHGPLVTLATGYLASILAIFAFSFAFRNTSFFDAWWMAAPVATIPFLAGDPGILTRELAVSALVILWAVRLTWNWIRGWMGLHQQDWRYLEMEKKSGRAYWLVSLGALHLFPGALVYAGSIAIVVAMRGVTPLGWLDVVAAIVTLGAIAIEAIADQQLHDFTHSGPPPGSTCDIGLWKLSRHPNYFGEMSFWVGLSLFALAADPTALYVLIGPISIIALFVFATIPMMEARQLERRREAYEAYRRRVSMVVPWFPRER